LHGSDAHDPAKVGKPDGNRFCWIKGDLTFESLRQACIEPEGLVAIIGARGSGKTALADLIAAGGHSPTPYLNDSSFVQRAKEYLGDASCTLTWESGEDTTAPLMYIETEELSNDSRVQYLSQQFVERLCSAEGLKDELLEEIERVIFQSHPI
jgi:hypothetical protein